MQSSVQGEWETLGAYERMVSTNHLNLPRGTGLEPGNSLDMFGRGQSLD